MAVAPVAKADIAEGRPALAGVGPAVPGADCRRPVQRRAQHPPGARLLLKVGGEEEG